MVQKGRLFRFLIGLAFLLAISTVFSVEFFDNLDMQTNNITNTSCIQLDGTTLCSWDNVNGSSGISNVANWTIDNNYLNNVSNTITFNDSKLNETITVISGMGNINGTYANDTYLQINDTSSNSYIQWDNGDLIVRLSS